VAARALEFTILNAVRTSETLHATWSEFDLDAKVWSIPASRTKTSTPLRIPLSDAALSILHEMRGLDSGWVFPAPSLNSPLSVNAMRSVLIRMGVAEEATVHGFRSTFRDWAGETTEFPRELVEMCLGHKVGSAVERAYRRGDALDRRRSIMTEWANYLR
jgi:integrase